MLVPIQKSHAHYQILAKVILHLNNNYSEDLSLSELALVSSVSREGLQQAFNEWAGASPQMFLKTLMKRNIHQKLVANSLLSSSPKNAPLPTSRSSNLLISYENTTPDEYKKSGQTTEISYGFHSCLFGYCFIAVTERGLCKLAFFDSEAEKENLIIELQEDWYKASIRPYEAHTRAYFQKIFSNTDKRKSLHLLLKTTPFKLKVWQALLNIPEGALSTYSDVAGSINNIKAVRAVASAIANNPIGYLIPCHRVVRNTGELSQYRWGKERKAAMIAKEQIRILASTSVR